MPARVCIRRCGSYGPADLEPALDEVLDRLGGLASFIRPGQRVLLKPNFIAGRPALDAAQTDPAVVLSLVRRVRRLGATPVVGDSPAWGRLEANLDALGLTGPLRDAGAEVVSFGRGRRLANFPMRVYRSFRVAREVLGVDCIINLPKLKAHQQLGLTAAIKNMFGCVAGKRKAMWHFTAGDKRNYFGWMLVELFDRLGPCLTLVDGVLGQEGNGPIRGRPRWFRWLIGGCDGVSVERVCAELLGFAPDELRTLRAARELGIGQPDLDRIEVVGCSIESQRIGDFQRADPMPVRFPLVRVVRSALKNLLLMRRQGSAAPARG